MFVCSWILTHMVGSYITRIWHTSYIYLAASHFSSGTCKWRQATQILIQASNKNARQKASIELCAGEYSHGREEWHRCDLRGILSSTGGALMLTPTPLQTLWSYHQLSSEMAEMQWHTEWSAASWISTRTSQILRRGHSTWGQICYGGHDHKSPYWMTEVQEA